MKRGSRDAFRNNLTILTAAWMLVMERDDTTMMTDLDLEAIKKAKDTLLSIDEEVADFEEEQDYFEKMGEELNSEEVEVVG